MTGPLKGKRILVGVSGGIAIYKMLSLLSTLNKEGAETEVIMTEGAKEFVTPLTFQTMSKHRVHSSLFSEEDGWIPHIDITRRSDVFLIAPATANVIAKLANGIADDLLTAAALASTCPILISPAMNVVMYKNEATQKNIEILRKRGVQIIEPETGLLACNEVGDGRLPEPEELLEVLNDFFTEKDLEGKKILVTAGATKERLDPVRFLTNDSSGRQGIALALSAKRRGAEVTLIHGHVDIAVPKGIKSVKIESTEELLDSVEKYFKDADALIMAAAPSDYRPENSENNKIKKDGSKSDLILTLKENPDIIKTVAKNKGNRKVIGFAAETENLLEYGNKKLIEKNLDYIVCNDVSKSGAGFNGNTNIVVILGKDYKQEYPKMTKMDVADRILDLLV